ncbi:MAG: hypothetical protein M9894_07420 [Planctomycetes bacterium]|nr:hypothetical protein [Planctomycetota bacterium]
MGRRQAAAIAVAAVGCAVAASGRDAVEATSDLLGPEAGRDAARLELRDVHGLWGGRDVRVDGTGRVVVRVVDRAQREARHEATLPPERARALLRLAAEEDVLRARVVPRPGVPDEARPALVVGGPGGPDREVSKWENDAVPAFDRVRAALVAVADEVTATTQPAHVGRYERAWRPPGTVAVHASIYSGRPNPTWELTPAQVEALRGRLRDLPPLGRPAKFDRLGGFLVEAHGVEGVPPSLWILDGAVGVRDHVRADAHGLEAWLRDDARARGVEVP